MITMEKILPTFGTGITSFAIEFPVTAKNLERVLFKIDALDIPRTNGRSIEFLVAHGIGGIDLDKPEESGTYEFVQQVGEKVRKQNYNLVITGFHPPGSPHMLSEKSSEVRHAVKRTKAIINCAVHAGAIRVVGPVHVEHGEKNGRAPLFLVDPLSEVGEYARKYDMRVCVEIIRGLETYALNSLKTAIPLLDKINESFVRLHYDVAHAAIHERDSPADAIARALDSGHVGHVHLDEIDRGPFSLQHPGPVQRALPEIVNTMIKRGYRNSANWEGFHYALWKAVGREDTVSASRYTERGRNEFARREAQDSTSIINEFYR